MLIRDYWKRVSRMIIVSLLLVISLNSIVLADEFSSADHPSSDLYPMYYSLQEIKEILGILYTNFYATLGDIESHLYYNNQSAAYYLYKIQGFVESSVSQLLLSNNYLSKIESHLATIAKNFGSSDGSSSGTDLSGITTKLDTLTGLIGIIQLRADTLISQLESTNTYLSAVSTKLDGVSSMVTSLNTVTTYLYSISTDVVDVLEELETATDLIGSTSLDVDALVAGMGVTQDLIAAVNTNLTTMIIKQELTFDYLADLSGDLGTVISNQNSVLSVLQQISDRLYYPDAGIDYYVFQIYKTLVNKLDTVIALLQEEGAFTTDIINALSYDGVSVAQHVRDFSLTAYLNMSFMIDHLSEMTYELSVVNQSLSSYLANKNSPLLTKLDTMLQNQQNVVDALSDDGYIGDELHDIAVDTHQIYIKLGAFQEQQNTLADQISKSLTHNNFSIAYYVWALGGLVESSAESILSNQSIALPVLQSMSESLTTISNRLYYVDASVSYYVYNISRQLREKLPVLISNQEAGLENQQKLIDLIEDLELTTNVTIENIENIRIDVTNKAYEVFYITDSEGNEQNLADFSGDVLTISGRLLNFFFKVAFDDAMDSVDSALDDMTEFYLDDSVVVGGSSLWE